MTVKSSTINDAEVKDYRSNSLWRLTLRRILRQRSAIIGLIILVILLLVAAFADVIAPYNPTQVLIGVEDVSKRQAPCIHLFGLPKRSTTAHHGHGWKRPRSI